MRVKLASSVFVVLALFLVAAVPSARADTFTPPCADFRTGPGSRTSGSYVSAQGADDGVYEILQKSLVGGVSHLTHVWKFCNVPAGTLSLLHEGLRPSSSDGDNFQFSCNLSCDGNIYQPVTGAIINKAFFPTGGLTSAMSVTTTAAVDIHLMINDTTGGGNLDTVKIDYLAIKTVP